MTFEGLPTDLQDVIVGFCWGITHAELQEELKMIELIKSWIVNPLFLQRKLTPIRGWRSQPTPLHVFEPIHVFGGWNRLFDWLMVSEVLFRMDFRLKLVNHLGTRSHWEDLMSSHWMEMENFSEFYNEIMKSRTIPWKPTYMGEPIVDFKAIFDVDLELNGGPVHCCLPGGFARV